MEIEKAIFFSESVFFQTGNLPSHERLEEEFPQVTSKELIDLHKHFEDTGLTAASESLLTPKQYLAARMLLNTSDRRSLRTKLKELGITVKEFDDWKQAPRFVHFLRNETQRRFKNADITADLELIKNLEDGDLKSIIYFNELSGRGPVKVTTPEAINVSKVLATMMEILVKYVDAIVLTKVAKELEDRLSQQLAESVIDVSSIQSIPPVKVRVHTNV